MMVHLKSDFDREGIDEAPNVFIHSSIMLRALTVFM